MSNNATKLVSVELNCP